MQDATLNAANRFDGGLNLCTKINRRHHSEITSWAMPEKQHVNAKQTVHLLYVSCTVFRLHVVSFRVKSSPEMYFRSPFFYTHVLVWLGLTGFDLAHQPSTAGICISITTTMHLSWVKQP